MANNAILGGSRYYKGKDPERVVELLESRGSVTFRNLADLWGKVDRLIFRRYPWADYTAEIDGINITIKDLNRNETTKREADRATIDELRKAVRRARPKATVGTYPRATRPPRTL